MIVNKPNDVAHKVQLLRLLTAIVDDPVLASGLYFKGGTCAAMSGFLNRFSVDLDFDVAAKANEKIIRSHLLSIFSALDLKVDTESDEVIIYAVKYPAPPGDRNTIHIDAIGKESMHTTYESRKLPEIDRVVMCQTLESMVSHKLIAALDRYARHKAVAGRDVYDIHEFLMHGYPYNPVILSERMGLTKQQFFTKLIMLFEKKVTQQGLDEDLSTVLAYKEFRLIRKTLRQETLMLLRGELEKT